MTQRGLWRQMGLVVKPEGLGLTSDSAFFFFSFAFMGQIPPSGPSFYPSARPSFQELKRETGGSSR